MSNVRNALVVLEVIVGALLMAGVLLQTPKATGLGGTIGGGEPGGAVADAINQAFGDFATFKDTLSKAAIGQFGSGWGWAFLAGGKLQVKGFPNQDNPVMEGGVPILGVDVWEHAYYLKYQNVRANYLAAWWNARTFWYLRK